MIPVIAIDGPSASGKGTVAERVAQSLGFHFLDSGALYRLVALAAGRSGISMGDTTALEKLAANLDVRFYQGNIYLNNQLVTDDIRSEICSRHASLAAAIPGVRTALLTRQRAFREAPGLVADGRDMGSVVFPDAVLKVFLTADPKIRAHRRYNQLMNKGIPASMQSLLWDIEERDTRDESRTVAPLKRGNALLLDTTTLTIQQAVDQVLAWFAEAQPGLS
ncbi:MAG: (d)CMP kinase [Betaproteobacteria bacterium]|nr:(d)CMP kinase [Betaproteobacteria bacterium]